MIHFEGIEAGGGKIILKCMDAASRQTLYRAKLDPDSPTARDQFKARLAAKANGQLGDVDVDAKIMGVIEGIERARAERRNKLASDEADDAKAKRAAADELLACCDGVDLFKCDEVAFATVTIKGHAQTMPVQSRPFKSWLRGEYYRLHRQAVRGDALTDAIGALDAKAVYEGKSWPVHTRLAPYGESIVLDLGGDDHLSVVIDKTGWRIVDRAPVRFIRRRGMQALPIPVSGGDLAELRELVNVPDDGDWALVLAWLVASMKPSGPYPIMEITGEQGCAKTTCSRILRALIDPNSAPVRAEPREARDLMIAATNAWIVAFDNLSDLSPWLSDALCRISTGGGFSTRSLYTNDEEVIFDAMRPVILNGITDIAVRPDLGDRAIRLTLPVIAAKHRRTEREVWAAFNAARPRILGAILDAVVVGLARRDSVKLAALPRMADFAEWATACEQGLGLSDGAFMAAFMANRRAGVEAAIEASSIGPALRTIIDARGEWSGTAADLLAALSDPAITTENQRKSKEWPGSPRKLSADLRRIAPALRAVGVDVQFHDRQGHARRRVLTVSRVGETSSACTTSSAIGHGAIENADSVRTIYAPGGEGHRPHGEGHRPHQNGDCELETRFADGADGADDLFPTYTGSASEYDQLTDG